MKKLFATLPTGEEIYTCRISGTNTVAEIITFGAIIRSLTVNGVDIVGGFDKIDYYLEDPGCQGAIIGRVANRIENAVFTVDGAKYEVRKNNGNNSLHGGFEFNRNVWNIENLSENSVTLSYLSRDGEYGFPGDLFTTVTYSFIGDALVIDYKATPTKKTPIALTNHAYFNLDGFGSDVKKHKLMIASQNYTEVNKALIPTGNRPTVCGTVFDFRTMMPIDRGLSEEEFRGYDNNFIITPTEFKKFGDKELGLAAVLENDSLTLSVYSDQPGLQVYTGNGLSAASGQLFKGGIKPVKYGAICLETQTEPNCINHGIGIYNAGETYTHTCVYSLKIKDNV